MGRHRLQGALLPLVFLMILNLTFASKVPDKLPHGLHGRRALSSLKRSFFDWLGARSMFTRRPLKIVPAAGGGIASIPRTSVVPSLRFASTGVYPCRNSYSWDSFATNSAFYTFLCIQMSGIHVAQTLYKSIIVIDRYDSNNTYFKLPTDNTKISCGEEIAWGTGFAQRPLNMQSNPFCGTGQFLPDGTLLSIGGTTDASSLDPAANGSFSIRGFKPCTDGKCDFTIVGTMTSKRWYPTAQILPDGRVLIVGGSNVFGNIAINDMGKNNPTIEYFPRTKGEGSFYMQFLVDTVPFNLYPFIHVLRSGLVFMFAANTWTLFNTTSNMEVPGPNPDGSYPDLDVVDATGMPVMRSYPVSATGLMFALSSANNYLAEIMICGGNNVKAIYVSGDRKVSTQVNNKIWADDMCWRITPEAPKPKWVGHRMCLDAAFINATVDSSVPNTTAAIPCQYPLPRLMGDSVLLLDGSVLILNGAQQGYAGLNQVYANTPQLQPLHYFPSNHSFSPTVLPRSRVARMYHSEALLLHDGTVFVAGSNPNEYLLNTGKYPTEFRTEIFAPFYLFTGKMRPVLFRAPKSVAVNSLFTISFNATQVSPVPPLKRFTISLVYPGFATHNNRHGQRLVFLDIAAITTYRTDVTYIAVVNSPPNLNIAPPTLYWIHVLDNGVPNFEGLPINVTRNAVF